MVPNALNSLRIDRAFSAVRQATGAGWAFDPLSFVIGMILAFFVVGLIYRFRFQIAQYWNRTKEKSRQLRQRLTANLATRYSANIIETAQTRHLFGSLVSFDDIYIETQLYIPLAPIQDTAEYPSLLPLQAIRACERLVVIGHPGSGRTMLLNHLLLLLAKEFQASGEHERVPVYAYLPVLAAEVADAAEADAKSKGAITPAQRLAQTALGSMSRMVATGATRWLRRQIETGNALILLDGWDEISNTDRSAVTAWIEDLSNTYSGNRLVVATGERGYAALVDIGCVPLQFIAWTDRQLADLALRWSDAWPFKDDDQDAVAPAISHSLAPPTPLEATIELVIELRGQAPASTPAGKMAQVFDLFLPPPEIDDRGHLAWPPETGHRALGRLAVVAAEERQTTVDREEIQSAVTEAMPPPQFATDLEQEKEIAEPASGAAREEQEQRTLQIVDCCRALTAPGAPLRSWDNQRYYFSHPLLAAYMAARYLAAEGMTVVPYVDDPAWLDVARFYVGMAPAGPLIGRLLSITDDALMNHLWTAATLLAASEPGDTPWRTALLTRLAQLFLSPRLPEPFREQCLVALVDSSEAGVGLLFKQAASSTESTLRAGAILGLGAMGREQDLLLIEAARSDPSHRVRLAAIHALSLLARMGNEQALEFIVTTLIEAEDRVQRAAAEALAELRPEGHAVLKDAAQDEDLIVRRVAVYGLSAVGEPWAREIVERMQLEDDEWLVRNAAAEALAETHRWDDLTALPYELVLPQPESEPWLIAWTAERGEGTGVGDAALASLIRALNEGDSPTREMALDTLRRLADPRSIDVLRRTLRDPDPIVRDTALIALDEISRRHDITITMN